MAPVFLNLLLCVAVLGSARGDAGHCSDSVCIGHRCDSSACPCGCECGSPTDPGLCFVPKNNMLLQSGSNTSTNDPRFATARAIYYPLLIVGLIFSTLLALALRTAPTKKSFTHQSSQAKAAFRLVLWGVALADMCHCLSVIPYLCAVWTPSESNTAALRSALEVAAVLSSTGILLSSALTACLAIEGYLIVSRGIRDGEQKRAVLYIIISLTIVATIQTITATQWALGPSTQELQNNTYVWSHLVTKNTASEIFSLYGPILVTFFICLAGYLNMEYKLRQMLKYQGMNDVIRKTLNRSRAKFISFPLMYILAWTPTAIFRIMYLNRANRNPDSPWNVVMLFIGFIFAEALPIGNALLFGWFNPEARESLLLLFRTCCRCCRARSREGESFSNNSDSDVPSWDVGGKVERGLLDDSSYDSSDRFSPRYSFGLQEGGSDWEDDLPPPQIYGAGVLLSVEEDDVEERRGDGLLNNI